MFFSPAPFLTTTLIILPYVAAQGGYHESKRVRVRPQAPSHDLKFYDFITRPDIIAPRWSVKIYDQDALSPGYWFVDPYEAIWQGDFMNRPWIGPHIYDESGELVWSGTPAFNGFILNDFRVSNVNGENMLTGIDAKASEGVIMNNHYEVHKRIPITGDNKNRTNRHDFHIVEDGTKSLAMTFSKGDANLGEVLAAGRNAPCGVRFGGFEEYDVNTLERTFAWSSEGLVFLNESYSDKACNKGYGLDYLHVNAVDKLPDGDYILSGRMTDTIYKISGKDGSIVWRLGGKQSDFAMDAEFSGQHAVRVVSQNDTHTVISFLNNAARPGDEHVTSAFSRGMVMALRTDIQPMTATTILTYDHPTEGSAPGQGYLQLLESGNAFLAWRNQTMISEHGPDSKLLMEAQIESEMRSYRSYKFEWTGYPQTPPDVYAMAVQDYPHPLMNSTRILSDMTTVVFVSWNGATEVKAWRLWQADEDGEPVHQLVRAPRNGFETTITYRGFVSEVIVEALDNHNKRLGLSKVFATIPPANVTYSQNNTGWTIDPSKETIWTKLEDFLETPTTMYALMAISCISTILLFAMFVYVRRRARDNSWLQAPQRTGRQKYELVVQDMDLEDERRLEKMTDDEEDDDDPEGVELSGITLASECELRGKQ